DGGPRSLAVADEGWLARSLLPDGLGRAAGRADAACLASSAHPLGAWPLSVLDAFPRAPRVPAGAARLEARSFCGSGLRFLRCRRLGDPDSERGGCPRLVLAVERLPFVPAARAAPQHRVRVARDWPRRPAPRSLSAREPATAALVGAPRVRRPLHRLR